MCVLGDMITSGLSPVLFTFHLSTTDRGPTRSFPRPSVRIHLHTVEDPPNLGQNLKLTALLRPIVVRPLTAASIFKSLSRIPFALLLSFLRISVEAWKLHYLKRLNVFIRPEPYPPMPTWGPGTNLTEPDRVQSGVGLKWQNESILEMYARCRVETFLLRRARETGTVITLIYANPAIPVTLFQPSPEADCSPPPYLKIWYLSPRMFTILYLSPSALHAYLLGNRTERLFWVSSEEKFLSVFTLPFERRMKMSMRQHLRRHLIPPSLDLEVPPTHVLDNQSFLYSTLSTFIIWTSISLYRSEEWLFFLFRARVVHGDEPWKQWERAAHVMKHGRPDKAWNS